MANPDGPNSELCYAIKKANLESAKQFDEDVTQVKGLFDCTNCRIHERMASTIASSPEAAREKFASWSKGIGEGRCQFSGHPIDEPMPPSAPEVVTNQIHYPRATS